ncbi:MAG: GNAT family N-acetyltransferase [Micrococcales bacterium]|nr:GNAT family N-acetyltransferase [Micrococcales bacterium]
MPVDLVSFDAADPHDEEQLVAWVEVWSRSLLHDLGPEQGSPWSVAEIRAQSMSPNYRRETVLAVDRASGEPVGLGGISLPLRDNTHLVTLRLQVDPAHRRQGIGSQILEWAHGRWRDSGRPTILCETAWNVGNDDGSGEFARLNGYAAAQTTVRSDQLLAETVPSIRAGLPAIVEQIGAAGYDTLTWVDGSPEEWFEQRAFLARRMSTDIPLGELDMAEEDWDAERIREEDRLTRESGRRFVDTVVRHRDSGQLAGYTRIAVSAETPHLAYQLDTLVIREHRGIRLGRALKAVNVVRLADELPGVQRVRTWNAEENSHMIAVNSELGYEPTGYLREWQRRGG